MGAYDSSCFSKMFSDRTVANYRYISKIVNRDSLEKKAQKRFLDEYNQLIVEIDSIKNELRSEASQIANIQKKGKNELKRELYSISSKLECSGSRLKSEMERLVSTDEIEGNELYEVTQLLNSLMGIAVLPYEMHKEFFQKVEDERQSEENRKNTLHEKQNSVRACFEYEELQYYIMDLHKKGKWKSTFSRDMKNGYINEDKIVFGFLRHIRNVTCHCGDNAISILPLEEGRIISHIMFYDKLDEQEFAMDITVSELESLVSKISEFYSKSRIGYINKTKNIEAAEARVKELLDIHYCKMPSNKIYIQD